MASDKAKNAVNPKVAAAVVLAAVGVVAIILTAVLPDMFIEAGRVRNYYSQNKLSTETTFGYGFGIVCLVAALVAWVMRGSSAGQLVQSVTGGGKPSAEERLKSLRSLLDSGAITQAEYDAKRAEALKDL